MRASIRKTLLFASLAGLIGFVVHDQVQQRSVERRSEGRSASQILKADRAVAPPERPPLALPVRPSFPAPAGELFATQSWQPPAPAVVAAPAPTLAPPPLPYRFVGTVSREGTQVVQLAKGDSVFSAAAGDTLDGAYKVESIGETEITFLYLPLKHRYVVAVTSSIAVAPTGAQTPTQPQSPTQAPTQTQAQTPTQPQAQGQMHARSPVGAQAPAVVKASAAASLAQLSWVGPSEVRLGAAFNVTLKVRSAESVQGSPMQIRFDPAILEAVAVHPGRFFAAAERNFNYRVNPDGTIFVGASNPQGTAAVDAELLVLTFKPLKPAPAAEVTIGSLALQGGAGKRIGFEPVSSYRPSIAP